MYKYKITDKSGFTFRCWDLETARLTQRLWMKEDKRNYNVMRIKRATLRIKRATL